MGLRLVELAAPLIITMMMMCIKVLRAFPSTGAFSTLGGSVAASMARPPPRLSTYRVALAATPTRNSPASYSSATQRRIEGLDAATEFNKLAQKLNKSPAVLKVAMQRRCSSNEAAGRLGTEKEEYLHWMLSGVDDGKNDGGTALQTKKAKKGPGGSKKGRKKTEAAVPQMPSEVNETKQTFQTDVRFDDDTQLSMHWKLRKAVAAMGLRYMTEIQAKTFAAASTGSDVLGRARTGTGKTVAFLLPAIERLVREGSIDDPTKVGMLVVSPTRELATQISDQAKQLLQYHQGTSVQVMFGGTNMKKDVNRLSSREGLPTVLVATPGRLLDHMESTNLKIHRKLVSFGKHIMGETNLVVLDETDRLLDMGFRRDIERILDYLPPSQHRQTLLFSATMPPELKIIMKQNMKAKYVEVDCIRDGDATTHTNDSVDQSHILLPSKEIDIVTSVIETVCYAVETHIAKDEDDGSSLGFMVPPKIVVFFPTARLVQFYAEAFQQITSGIVLTEHTAAGQEIQLPSWELHSKKSQGYRNRVSDEFRKAAMGVLFTSDVSARGVDYPNVSHVIQFGMPESREQYIHRLGRTGRAGSKGKGWLVLQDWEAAFLRELKGVDIPRNDDLAATFLEQDISEDAQRVVREVRRRVRGGDGVLSKRASAAYAAFLGYYKAQMKRMGMREAERLVGIANDFAEASGFAEPPQLQKSTVGKMGLKGVAGLNMGGGKGPPGGGGGGHGGGHHGGGGRRGNRSNRMRR